MDYFEKQTCDDVIIEKVNLHRATMMEASTMKARLLENISVGQKKIVVDISQCNFIDSTFFGALVFSLKRIRSNEGEIKLIVKPASNSEEIINLSNVRNIFDIYTSMEDALNDYKL